MPYFMWQAHFRRKFRSIRNYAHSQIITRWYLMDRAGRRPILLSGAVAMAIALTATGWWIYIDQAITPNAGSSFVLPCRMKLMVFVDSGHLRSDL